MNQVDKFPIDLPSTDKIYLCLRTKTTLKPRPSYWVNG